MSTLRDEQSGVRYWGRRYYALRRQQKGEVIISKDYEMLGNSSLKSTIWRVFYASYRILPYHPHCHCPCTLRRLSLCRITTYFEPKEEMRPNCWKRTLYSRNSQGELVGLLFALTLDISQGECAVHGFPAGRMVDGFIERCTQKSDTEEGGIP